MNGTLADLMVRIRNIHVDGEGQNGPIETYIPSPESRGIGVEEYREMYHVWQQSVLSEGHNYLRGNNLRTSYVCTKIDGKLVFIHTPYKRKKTKFCELCCQEYSRLHYHHWDKNDANKGLWLCYRCHMAAEVFDDYTGLEERYRQLKSFVEHQFLADHREDEGAYSQAAMS